jgi:hypothetical protein
VAAAVGVPGGAEDLRRHAEVEADGVVERQDDDPVGLLVHGRILSHSGSPATS